MTEANPASTPRAAAPANLPQSTKYDYQVTRTESDNKDQSAMSTNSASDETPATVLGVLNGGEMRQSPKRSQPEVGDEIDALPAPKRLATEEKSQSNAVGSTSRTARNPLDGRTAEGNEDDLDVRVRPEKLHTPHKAKSKSARKQACMKLSRAPACAACKRRKVKCEHRSVEDDTAQQPSSMHRLDGQGTAPKFLEPKDTTEPTSVTIPARNPLVPKPEVCTAVSACIEAEPSVKCNAKKKAAPTKAKVPPERSSMRNRKAPERFEDLQDQPMTKALPTKKSSRKVFDPVYITTNSTSRLGKADMYHMLVDDETAWTSLSAEQQADLIAMLPDTADNQQLLIKIRSGETDDTRPQYLKASDVFRTEVAKFQADLTNGHLAKTWRIAAEQAIAERAEGQYDSWKADEAELWWGQKSN